MDSKYDDLVSVPEAAKRAGVARNTMLLAAKNGNIHAIRLGRNWYVHISDIERWKDDHYRPDMALRYPVETDTEEGSNEDSSASNDEEHPD